MIPADILQTDRLVLREASRSDIDATHAIASDFDVVRNTGSWPWPPDPAFTASRCQPIPADEGLGGMIFGGDDLVGMTHVFGEGELGYMLGRPHWGQGYATEICRALIDLTFATGRWNRLKACVFQDNPGSAHVLRKLGFAEGAACVSKCTARGRQLPTRNFTLEAPRT